MSDNAFRNAFQHASTTLSSRYNEHAGTGCDCLQSVPTPLSSLVVRVVFGLGLWLRLGLWLVSWYGHNMVRVSLGL